MNAMVGSDSLNELALHFPPYTLGYQTGWGVHCPSATFGISKVQPAKAVHDERRTYKDSLESAFRSVATGARFVPSCLLANRMCPLWSSAAILAVFHHPPATIAPACIACLRRSGSYFDFAARPGQHAVAIP